MLLGSEIRAPPPIRERVTAVQQDVWKCHGMEWGAFCQVVSNRSYLLCFLETWGMTEGCDGRLRDMLKYVRKI